MIYQTMPLVFLMQRRSDISICTSVTGFCFCFIAVDFCFTILVSNRLVACFSPVIIRYVNETGHDINLKQNVFITAESQARIVKYFFLLPEGETMKKGQKLELLTNYFEPYEPQRKRHMYSREHMYEGFTSTPATDLQDGINMRTLIFDFVEARLEESADAGTTRLPGLYQLLDAIEALYLDTFLPIYDAIEKFRSSGNLQSVSSIQILANRRFQMLRWPLGKALNTFQAIIDANNQGYLLDPRQGVVLQLGKVLDDMKCHPYIYKEALSDERVLHGETSSIKEALLKEALEEVCYVLENTMLMPLDASMWCKVARSLMEKLSMWVAKIWWPVEDENEEKQHSARTELKNAFLKEAAVAAKAVRDAETNGGNREDLEFESGITVEYIVAKFSYLLRDTQLSSAFYLDNTITPKWYVDRLLLGCSITVSRSQNGASLPFLFSCFSYRAMMVEQLAYWDACALLGTPPEPWDAHLERDGRFLMVKSEHGPDSVRKLGSVPRSTKRKNLDINLTWYLVWQVAYVVDCFADGFLRSPRGDEFQRAHCLVEELCKAVNIDSCLLEFARDRGMKDYVDSGFDHVCKKATKFVYIEKNRWGKISKRSKSKKKTKAKAAALPAETRNKTKPEPNAQSDVPVNVSPKPEPNAQNDVPVNVSPNPAPNAQSDVPVNVSRKTKPEPKSDLPVDVLHRPQRKKHPTPVKRRALPSCRPEAKKIEELSGRAPTELMGPGELMEHGWPQGWRKDVYERQSGGTKGDRDRYWFTPSNRKLRSLAEVKRYMAALEFYNDEEAAYRARKSSRFG